MNQTFTNAADWSDYFYSTPSSTATAVVSTTIPTLATDPDHTTFSFDSAPPSSNNPVNNRANRVTKPARKRSRASRRTPTTLLSTDTSNFRAMVQQFTGGPSALGFGIGATIDHPQPRRVTDQQLHGSGGGLTSSSSPFTIPSPGYNFHFHQHQPTQQAAYGGGEMEQARRLIVTSTAVSAPNVKSNGGVDSLWY
ncbi:hypothetical protein QQ045_028077 [Rhodiola kirilowii]